VAEELLACQEGLSCMVLVSISTAVQSRKIVLKPTVGQFRIIELPLREKYKRDLV
jgi:hypothetical protein